MQLIGTVSLRPHCLHVAFLPACLSETENSRPHSQRKSILNVAAFYGEGVGFALDMLAVREDRSVGVPEVGGEKD